MNHYTKIFTLAVGLFLLSTNAFPQDCTLTCREATFPVEPPIIFYTWGEEYVGVQCGGDIACIPKDCELPPCSKANLGDTLPGACEDPG